MIELRNVTKYYKSDIGKQYVLNNVSLKIPSNINLGILGRNGAGKSTLLRILGGIDFPNSGSIHSNKSFSWPMGLSGGFQGSMTGRQNVKFVCRIYGRSKAEIDEAIESVKDFSELKEYFDLPIKSYSSGMKAKLSFGLSLFFDFDYLLIDETLSVGDASFQEKSKMALRKKINKCNIILVSHGMPILKELCQAGIVVHEGELEYFEDINEAIERYAQINKEKK